MPFFSGCWWVLTLKFAEGLSRDSDARDEGRERVQGDGDVGWFWFCVLGCGNWVPGACSRQTFRCMGVCVIIGRVMLGWMGGGA